MAIPTEEGGSGTAPIAPVAPVTVDYDGMGSYVPFAPMPLQPDATGKSLSDLKGMDKTRDQMLEEEFNRMAAEARKRGYQIATAGNGTVDYSLVVKKGVAGAGSSGPEFDDDGNLIASSGGGGKFNYVNVDPSSDPFVADLYNTFNMWREAANYAPSATNAPSATGGSGSGATGAAFVRTVDPTKEAARRLQDFLTRADAMWDFTERSQNYSMKAAAANMAREKAYSAGQGQYGDLAGGRYYIDDPGMPDFASMLAPTIPDFVQPDYQAEAEGLYGAGVMDSDYTDNGYPLFEFANGTKVPGYANGTIDLFAFYGNPGGGYTYPWSTQAPFGSSASAYPGQKNTNMFLPPEQRTFAQQDWVNSTTAEMLRRIATNNGAGAPPGIPDYLDAMWQANQGRGDNVSENFAAALAQWVGQNVNNPGLQQAFGTAPAPDPNRYSNVPIDPNVAADNARADAQLALAYQQHNLSVAKFIQSQAGSSGGGGGGGSAVLRQSGSNTSPYSAQYYTDQQAGPSGPSDPDLEKKLALEYAKLKLQEELGRRQMDLDEQNSVYDRAYKEAMTKQIKDSHDLALLKYAADEEARLFDQTLKSDQFQEQLRRARVEEFYTGQKLDIEKAANEIQRGKVIAEQFANPNDAVAREFFIRGMGEPVGTARDMFTGRTTGMKTLTQARIEDQPLAEYNRSKPTQVSTGLYQRAPDSFPEYQQNDTQWFGGGTMYGYTTEPMFVTGDPPQYAKGTGYPELIHNPTGAPIMVVNSRDTRRMMAGRH